MANNLQQLTSIHKVFPMNLTDLKKKPIEELIDIAHEMGLENIARSRKQDIIFNILKRHAKGGEDIYGDGVLEILVDGFGFLRSADSSYLAGPDDIYVFSGKQGFEFKTPKQHTTSILARRLIPLM